jgi:hypothetical protein
MEQVANNNNINNNNIIGEGVSQLVSLTWYIVQG